FLLTARDPFSGDTPLETVLQHHKVEAVPVSEHRPDVPPGVEAVVRKLMAKRPEDRYQTPAELAAALEPFCPAVAGTERRSRGTTEAGPPVPARGSAVGPADRTALMSSLNTVPHPAQASGWLRVAGKRRPFLFAGLAAALGAV